MVAPHIQTHTPSDTQAYAKEFVISLCDSQRGAPSATIVGLYGNLGSGKTTFVQGVARALGVEGAVASPTFVLQKIYKLDQALQQTFQHLVHIDAYRIESLRELDHIGWHDLVADSRTLVCIEWPERVAEGMPAHIRVACEYIDDTTRSYTISHE